MRRRSDPSLRRWFGLAGRGCDHCSSKIPPRRVSSLFRYNPARPRVTNGKNRRESARLRSQLIAPEPATLARLPSMPSHAPSLASTSAPRKARPARASRSRARAPDSDAGTTPSRKRTPTKSPDASEARHRLSTTRSSRDPARREKSTPDNPLWATESGPRDRRFRSQDEARRRKSAVIAARTARSRRRGDSQSQRAG